MRAVVMFIEQLYEKRFGRARPEVVIAIEERAKLDAEKNAQRKKEKAMRSIQ